MHKFPGNHRYKISTYNSMYIVKCIDLGNKKLTRKGLVEFTDFKGLKYVVEQVRHGQSSAPTPGVYFPFNDHVSLCNGLKPSTVRFGIYWIANQRCVGSPSRLYII